MTYASRSLLPAPFYVISSNGSVEVKAKEKNREHAKNTRMRKKSYIESLKDDVKQLSDLREKTDDMRKLQLQVRKRVIYV